MVIHSVGARVAYSGLIYRKVIYRDGEIRSIRSCFLFKVLRLSSQTMNNYSSGQITNLLANDANYIEVAHYFINYLWVSHDEKRDIVKKRTELFSWLPCKFLQWFCYCGTLSNMSHSLLSDIPCCFY